MLCTFKLLFKLTNCWRSIESIFKTAVEFRKLLGPLSTYWSRALPGADPENCFGRGTFGLESPKTTKQDAEGFDGEMYGQGVYPLPSRLGGLGERRKLPQRGLSGAEPQLLIIFGHYIHNFVRIHACFSAFWNLTGKANKTESIRALLPVIGLEGARAPCATIWIRPCDLSQTPLGSSRRSTDPLIGWRYGDSIG